MCLRLIEASTFYLDGGRFDAPVNPKLSSFRGGRRQHLRIAETILKVLESSNEDQILDTLLRIEKKLRRIEGLLDPQSGTKLSLEPPNQG